MKCAYCHNEIVPGKEIEYNGNYFCNSLHRYSWNNDNLQTKSPAKATASTGHPASSVATGQPSILRRSLWSLVYTIVFYFIFAVVIGGVVGGIAGAQAGYAGQDAAEAGRLAGQEFSSKYGLLLILISIALAVLGSFQCWLPGTRRKKIVA